MSLNTKTVTHKEKQCYKNRNDITKKRDNVR